MIQNLNPMIDTKGPYLCELYIRSTMHPHIHMHNHIRPTMGDPARSHCGRCISGHTNPPRTPNVGRIRSYIEPGPHTHLHMYMYVLHYTYLQQEGKCTFLVYFSAFINTSYACRCVLMAQRKTTATPLLTHWSHSSPASSHQHTSRHAHWFLMRNIFFFDQVNMIC